ncbi:hypothetical protein [Streptomyces sp. NPDC001665]
MRQVPTGWTGLIVTVAAVVATATGCGDQPDTGAPASSDALLGHWRSDCGATLDVAEGGRFTFADFPSGQGPHDKRRLNGSGEWYLYRGGKGALPASLDLTFKGKTLSLYFVNDSRGEVEKMHLDEEDTTCYFTPSS